MDDKNDIYNLDPLEMIQHFLLNLNHKNTYGQYHFDIPYYKEDQQSILPLARALEHSVRR